MKIMPGFFVAIGLCFSASLYAENTNTPLPDPFSRGIYDVQTSIIEVGDNNSPRIFSLFVPQGATGSLPVVHFLHGFFNNHAWYDDFLTHLASHGYIVVSSQSIHDLFGGDTSIEESEKVLTFIEWFKADLPDRLSGISPDFDRFGLAGHSRGGKVTNRVLLSQPDLAKAFFGVDPVDSEPPFGNDPSSLDTPVRFTGDSFFLGTENGGSCAPEGDNSANFFDKYPASTRHIIAKGIGHVDMLDEDDLNSCGLICDVCDKSGDEALNQSFRQYIGGLMVAFFGSALKGETGYDLILDDIKAQPFETTLSEKNPLWYVTSTANNGGTITPPSQRVNDGQKAQISVVPEDGFETLDITGCGVEWSGEKVITTDIITTHCTVKATFAEIVIEPDIFSIESENISAEETIFTSTYDFDIQLTGQVFSNSAHTLQLLIDDTLYEEREISVSDNGQVSQTFSLIFDCPLCTIPSSHDITVIVIADDQPETPLASYTSVINIVSRPVITIDGLFDSETLSDEQIDITITLTGSEKALALYDRIELRIDDQSPVYPDITGSGSSSVIAGYTLYPKIIDLGAHTFSVNAYQNNNKTDSLISYSLSFIREPAQDEQIDENEQSSDGDQSSDEGQSSDEASEQTDDNLIITDADQNNDISEHNDNSSSGGSGGLSILFILMLGLTRMFHKYSGTAKTS